MNNQDNLFGIEANEAPVAFNTELDLEQSITKLAKEFQGVVDDNDFKNCFIIVLFYRFISENYDDIIEKECLFNYVKDQLNQDINLNDYLKSIFSRVEKAKYSTEWSSQFEGLFDDFKGLYNRHIKLLFDCIARLNISNEHTDYFGFIFEYFLMFYSSNSRKYSGAFFTPVCVSKLLARLVRWDYNGTELEDPYFSIYDPTCSSGTLLLSTYKELKKDGLNIKVRGQEINKTSSRLAQMNMIINTIHRYDIGCGDTLLNPLHKNERFDAIVSNPPYSIKWAGTDNPDLIKDERYSPAGVLAPKGKADFAFIMHSLYHLKERGSYYGVVFPGVLYRDGAEAKIRKYLIDNNLVKAVIQLPSKLFYGTDISVCIMILSKKKEREGVVFVDASNECVKDGKFNTLTEENINNISSWVNVPSRLKYRTQYVTNEEIAKNKYALTVSQYVEKEDKREKIDIIALNREIRELHARNEANFQKLEACVREFIELLGIIDE